MYNKWVFLVYLFFNAYVNAADWQEHWIKAVEYCEDKNYEEAHRFFDLAIHDMEADGDTDHPHVYVDRARLNLLLNHIEKSIPDLNKALTNEKLNYQEKQRALLSRFIARSQLGMEKGALEDLQAFNEHKIDKPVMEMTKSKIIIRNIPNCDFYDKFMTCYFIHSGMCESKNDVKMLKSGICIIDRACNCERADCEEINAKDRVCDACGMVIHSVSRVAAPNGEEANCKAWRDRAAVAGGTWCGKTFKSL